MNWLKKISLVACFSCLLLSACQEDTESLLPKACLMVDNNYPKPGEFITFTDCSEEAYRIEVNFGDGTFARYSPVKHSYLEEGTYSAKLTGWSEDGRNKSESIQKIIVSKDTSTIPPIDTTIIPPGSKPTACFTPADTIGEAGSSILFLNCSLNASSFSWDFDDGSTSTVQNPTHVFTAPGTYNVKLTANNASAHADTTIGIKIGERVLATITLTNFNPLNPSGVAWDDLGFPIPGVPTEPDVFVQLTSASGGTFSTSIKSNLTTSALPATWDVTTQSLALTNENWTVIIYDDEGFFGTPTEMLKWENVNLGSLGSNGSIQFSTGSFAVDLNYVIR